ncbi:hypothetical protein EVAR_20601_1 [Eumeta japonica]|uniref:Uncharacterized protein n=1 Tax=Eumeta variegata TaxID=151549 RepID=A0A4C1US07_EUMVA|nr:hypothetical protein EVAR_20601_1 [Eumeta japonica]
MSNDDYFHNCFVSRHSRALSDQKRTEAAAQSRAAGAGGRSERAKEGRRLIVARQFAPSRVRESAPRPKIKAQCNSMLLVEKPTEEDSTITAVGDTSAADHVNVDDVCMAHIRAEDLEEPQTSKFFKKNTINLLMTWETSRTKY